MFALILVFIKNFQPWESFLFLLFFYSKFHFCMKFLYEIDFHLKFYLRNCVMPISILFLLVKLFPYLSWFIFVIMLVRTEFL